MYIDGLILKTFQALTTLQNLYYQFSRINLHDITFGTNSKKDANIQIKHEKK